MLCISTSERVPRTSFAGQNKKFDNKQLFPSLTEKKEKKETTSNSKSKTLCDMKQSQAPSTMVQTKLNSLNTAERLLQFPPVNS